MSLQTAVMVTVHLEIFPSFAYHKVIATVECKAGMLALATISEVMLRQVELSHNTRSRRCNRTQSARQVMQPRQNASTCVECAHAS
jgi:hypothetical protein